MWWDQWSSSKDGTCYHRSRVDWCPCPTGRVLPGSHWDIPPMTGRVTGWWTGGARGQGHISPQAAGDRHRSSSMVKNCHAGLLIRVESCGILSSIRRWFNGAPASKTLAHRWISVGNVLNRSTLLQIPKSVAVLARRLAPTGPVFCLSPAPFSGSVPFPSSPVTRAVPATHSRAGLAGIPPASRQLLREGHIDRDHGWADTAWWELCHRAPCRTPPETRRPQRFRRAILSAKPPTGSAKVREYSPVRPLGKINNTRGVPSKITTFYRTVWENADFQPCFAEARQRWRWMSTHQTSLTLAANAKPLGGGGGGVCFAPSGSGGSPIILYRDLLGIHASVANDNNRLLRWRPLRVCSGRLNKKTKGHIFQEKHHAAWLPGVSLAYHYQEKHHACSMTVWCFSCLRLPRETPYSMTAWSFSSLCLHLPRETPCSTTAWCFSCLHLPRETPCSMAAWCFSCLHLPREAPDSMAVWCFSCSHLPRKTPCSMAAWCFSWKTWTTDLIEVNEVTGACQPLQCRGHSLLESLGTKRHFSHCAPPMRCCQSLCFRLTWHGSDTNTAFSVANLMEVTFAVATPVTVGWLLGRPLRCWPIIEPVPRAGWSRLLILSVQVLVNVQFTQQTRDIDPMLG